MDDYQASFEPTISKKIFIVPILFFLLFTLITVASIFIYKNYQLKKPSTQTRIPPSSILADWQSYTNQKYGFMVSYPSTITPKIIPTDTSLYLVSFKNETNEKAIWFSIQVDQNTLNKEVDLIRSQTEGHIPAILTKKSEITHLGFPGFRLEYKPTNSDSGLSMTYIIVNNDIFSYTISAPSTNIDLILSTFKFIDDIKTWKDFTIDNISFKFPSSWVKKTNDIPSVEEKYIEEIKDPRGDYSLIFSMKKNVNTETGGPFTNINEYMKVSNNTRTTNIDGQPAIQPLPRAGSENINLVAFFSKDLKNILILQLDTPKDGSKIDEGQQLFDKILSSFKFFDPYSTDTTDWKTYSNNQYGFEFQYPKTWYFSEELPEGDISLGQKYAGPGYNVRINVRDNQNMLSSKTYLDKLISDSSDPKTYLGGIGILKSASREDVIIGGLPAGKLNNVFAFDHNEERIYIVKHNIVFNINYLEKEENQNYSETIKNYEVVQKILSTFRFSSLTNNIVLVTQKLLDKGWYQSNEKLSGTPEDWIYNKADGGGTDCWHKPNVNCL